MKSVDNNIVSILEQNAQNTPDKTALVFKNEELTFGELLWKVRSCANLLSNRGIAQGDRVIIMIPMTPELYITLLAVISVGAVVVFVDPWIPIKQIAKFSAFAEPKGFIGVPKAHLLRLFERDLRKLPFTMSTEKTFGGILAKCSLEGITPKFQNSPVAVDLDDTALITFTSGSSGAPKGANRTHGFLTAQYNALCSELNYPTDTVDLCMFPVFALRNLASGVTSVIPEIDFKNVADADGKLLANQIAQFNVNTITASPPLLDNLVHHYETSAESKPSNLTIFTGGAPVSDDQLVRWKACLPNATITVVYGSTEAEPVSHIDSEERITFADREGFCCGKMSSLLKTKIISISKDPISADQLHLVTFQQGEIGELIVQGDHVCRDYFRNSDAVIQNKIIDSDGTLWHRMGDTGYFDEEGNFFLTGRVHSTINRNGQLIQAQSNEQENIKYLSNAKRIASVEVDQQLVLVIQGTISMDEEQKIDADRIIVTDKPLPLDPRHNAKVDYDTLRDMIIQQKL